MLDDVLPLLRCPVCALPLAQEDRVVRCRAGHAHDVARHGYLNLLSGRGAATTPDAPSMVAARERFLGAGHFAPLSAALAAAVRTGPVVDLGAGTGHHLAAVLDAHDGPGLALDLSRPAAQRAARAHPRIGSVVADAWRALPLLDGVAGAVLSVFAPRAPAETARVLAPGGRLVVATPTPRHLAQLVAAHGLVTVDPDKPARLDRQLEGFALVDEVLVEAPLDLTAGDVHDVVAMGPSAHHVDLEALHLAPVRTLLSVRVGVYVRDGAGVPEGPGVRAPSAPAAAPGRPPAASPPGP